MKGASPQTYTKNIAKNRKALHDYFIDDKYEAGLVLKGTEVKSLRLGRANLKDSYAKIQDGEVFLYQLHIGEYPMARYDNHPPLRVRKLLLHKQEIKRLIGKIQTKGYTLVPLELYFMEGKAKVLLGLARGKKKVDKRQSIKERELNRELDRERKK
jgi:SsrA-binding protein